MQINKDWKIESDSMGIILYQRIVSKPTKEKPQGVGRWEPTFHPTVEYALKELVRREVQETELKDLILVNKRLNELFELIKDIKVVTLEKIVYRATKKREE